MYNVLTVTTMSDSVGSALQDVAAEAMDVLATVAPIAIGIAGAFLVWRYGMRFFKSISK